MLWIEPRDLALLAAALIAGFFTRISSLNSKNDEIVKIKSEWMDSFRDDIADFCECFLSISLLKLQISSLSKQLSYSESDSEEADVINQMSNLEGRIAEKSNEYHGKRVALKTKLKKSKDYQLKILTKIDQVRVNLVIDNSSYGRKERTEAKRIVDDIINLSGDFSESEWSSFKEGDSKVIGEIIKERKNVNIIAAVFILYIILFSIFSDGEKNKEENPNVKQTQGELIN